MVGQSWMFLLIMINVCLPSLTCSDQHFSLMKRTRGWVFLFCQLYFLMCHLAQCLALQAHRHNILLEERDSKNQGTGKYANIAFFNKIYHTLVNRMQWFWTLIFAFKSFFIINSRFVWLPSSSYPCPISIAIRRARRFFIRK